MRTQSFKVDSENNQLRLDVFLTLRLTALRVNPEDAASFKAGEAEGLTKNSTKISSRSFIKRLIEDEGVRVNGKNVKVHTKVMEGDEITIDIPEEIPVDERIHPENIPLDILYEDQNLLVVNKPSGMLVHPASGHYSGTLVNAILYHSKHLSEGGGFLRPGIVHRLDQETSGLLVVAKDNVTHMNLSRQFEKHLVKKRYVALVEGQVEFDEGLIDASLGRHRKYFDKKAVSFDDSARKAKTFYRVLKRFKTATYVACFPKTGRTHQLRVHLAYLGHPILGDSKYGKKNLFPRLALHAQSLGFFHPRTTKFMEFSIVPPEEFLSFPQGPSIF